MEITIDIPDQIATVVDAFLKTLKTDPKPDPANPGTDIIRPEFPNGLDDWAQKVIGQNLLQIPVVHRIPEVVAIHAQIAAQQAEVMTVVKPRVTRGPKNQ